MLSAITQITLGNLIDEIKLEAKLSGSSDLDTFILNLINELLLEYCFKNRYAELLQLNIPILTIAARGTYTLPEDLQHIDLVRYQDSTRSIRTLYKRNAFLANPIGTIPKYYQISGLAINLMPFDGVLDNETILFDYYSMPTKLEDKDNDIFPIPRLYGSLKQRAIYRALKYNAVATADSFKSDAAEEEARVRPNG